MLCFTLLSDYPQRKDNQQPPPMLFLIGWEIFLAGRAVAWGTVGEYGGNPNIAPPAHEGLGLSAGNQSGLWHEIQNPLSKNLLLVSAE